MLLSLVIWVGGIIFFAFVLAPTVFAVLPSHHLAGNVVSRALTMLHWIGVVSGLVFLITSLLSSRVTEGTSWGPAVRHLLILVMIVLTLISQISVSGRMAALRTRIGVIDDVPVTDARRIEFNRLHLWSTRLEVAVLACGLVVVYLTARQMAPSARDRFNI